MASVLAGMAGDEIGLGGKYAGTDVMTFGAATIRADAAMRLAEDMPTASAEDRALRQRVVDALAEVPKDGWRSVDVVVHEGSVELRGATTDAGFRERLAAAARGVAGVKELDDRVVVVGPASGRT